MASTTVSTTSTVDDATTTVNIKVEVSPTDTDSPTVIKDADNTTIATWSPETSSTDGSLGAWLPQDGDATIGSNDQPIAIWLNENGTTLRNTTINLIEDNYTVANANNLYNNGTYTPFNTHRDGQEEDARVTGALETTRDIEIEIESTGVRGLDGSLPPYRHYYYPQDLESNKQDRLKFTMKGYGSLKKDTSRIFSQGHQVRSYERIRGSVILPINPVIKDNNAVDWNQNELNAIQSRLAGASLSLMESSNWEDAGAKLSTLMSAIGKESVQEDNNLVEALKVYLAQQAVGGRGLLSRATGAVLNPNLEQLFQGPKLRNFAFRFPMSPRDEHEAQQVREIIRFFKQGMSVKSTANNVFLKAPNVFDIRYITYDDDGREVRDHPSINRIKTCSLTSCAVNYTPDNSYMTYGDDARTMTSYEMALNFTELTPVYEEDYNNRSSRDAVDGTWRRSLSTNEVGY